MHRVSLIFIAIPIILLAAVTVAISSTVSEDAFARDGGRYTDDTSQAAAVSNECLNPILDSNTIDNMVDVGNCGGTVSQQDESGSASAPITSQIANPTIELQRSTTQTPLTGTPPQTCEACFNVLDATQKSLFEANLALNPFPTPPNGPFAGNGVVTSIEEFCEQWKEFSPEERNVVGVIENLLVTMEDAGIPQSIQLAILNCLTNSVG
jgi:hypothetical protein